MKTMYLIPKTIEIYNIVDGEQSNLSLKFPVITSEYYSDQFLLTEEQYLFFILKANLKEYEFSIVQGKVKYFQELNYINADDTIKIIQFNYFNIDYSTLCQIHEILNEL